MVFFFEFNDCFIFFIISDFVVFFMKGDCNQLQCGFLVQIIQVLDCVLVEYMIFDVFFDMEVCEGIKEFFDWLMILQFYIGGEFQGGCDIVKEMYESGEFYGVFGFE